MHDLQAQAATLHRIGQGGLNEASAAGMEAAEGGLGEPGRRDREVLLSATTFIIWSDHLWKEYAVVMWGVPCPIWQLQAWRGVAGRPTLSTRDERCGL